ncbi:uncharacterized protein LOC123010674 [Tribolium madens]|uniref:uncharacterized protein LOC123010674 n=1 Tax=Tribolium madens TaxID=41895 RepID=UPI001CF74759|nr:uncharacterized protein LOC123010674 [Tribolium madens]
MSDNEDAVDASAGSNTLYKPSFVLIAIDTDPSMFVKNESDGNIPFKDCISACYNLANSLIFVQNKRSWSPFGIVLAREDASASLINFKDNILESIKLLKEKNELSEDKLLDLYQRKGGLNLSSFFLFCKKKFKEVNSAFYKRTIIYVTSDDNPVKDDKNQRFAALNEAKNFGCNDITFELVTMSHNFDYKIFYNELFSIIKSPPVETVVEDEDGLLEKLSSLIVRRFYQRRLLFFPFLNDQTRFLKIKQKSFVQEEKLYNNACISESGKLLKKVSKVVNDVIETYNLRHADGTIEFSVEERFKIKNTDLPVGYTLIQVSDRVTDVGIVLTHPAIIEIDPKEELDYFASFWQYCVDKNKVLICFRKLKKLDKICFVEFIPKFMNNNRVFLVKTIPFNDEHQRTPSDLATEEQSESYSGKMRSTTNELINELTFDYDPKMFTNPSLTKKKAYLRSKLLDEPQGEVEDVSLDSAAIDKRLGDIGESFKKLFALGEETAPKRKAPSTARGSKKKKA